MNTEDNPVVAGYHLAQLNVARLKYDSFLHPDMVEFTSRIEEINNIADNSPGFVWRLPQDPADIAALDSGNGPPTFINMSVWESLEQLQDYMYKTAHAGLLSQRRRWMEKSESHNSVLWWISEGHIPSLEEGEEKLFYLQKHGPSEIAFTFRNSFAPPHKSDQYGGSKDFKNH